MDKTKCTETTVMSHTLFAEKVLPQVEKGIPTFFILIDNLRLDQWKSIQSIFAESFRILHEETFFPSSPQQLNIPAMPYSAACYQPIFRKPILRNGRMTTRKVVRNLYEESFFRDQLKRLKRQDLRFSYTKIVHHDAGQQLVSICTTCFLMT
jgi:hypothetical protein